LSDMRSAAEGMEKTAAELLEKHCRGLKDLRDSKAGAGMGGGAT